MVTTGVGRELGVSRCLGGMLGELSGRTQPKATPRGRPWITHALPRLTRWLLGRLPLAGEAFGFGWSLPDQVDRIAVPPRKEPIAVGFLTQAICRSCLFVRCFEM